MFGNNNSGIGAGFKGNNLILDKIPGAVAVYSLIKRKKKASKCIRVRRSGDNTEFDFGFVGNSLDTAALLAFVGLGSGYITKWYDQSANGNDAVQATANNQPRIVNAGILDTVNNNPALYFNGTSSRLSALHSTSLNLQNPAISMVIKPTRVAGSAFEYLVSKSLSGTSTTGWVSYLRTSVSYVRFAYFGTSSIPSTSAVPDPRNGFNHHLILGKNAGNLSIYENGLNYANESYTDQSVLNGLALEIGYDGNNGSPQYFYQGYFQEIIIFSGSIQNNASLLYSSAKANYGVV